MQVIDNRVLQGPERGLSGSGAKKSERIDVFDYDEQSVKCVFLNSTGPLYLKAKLFFIWAAGMVVESFCFNCEILTKQQYYVLDDVDF